ncbi:MAG TPA: lipopolysaccharide transport periplasmic protein LptA [Rhodanobacteraceae bacterium]|nr:lipopolysaccharide transport periplasmic protein LptA [Rhodanobacteraceae bacterium]
MGRFILLVAMLAACGSVQAKQSDKDQPIQLNATGHLVGSQQSGKIVVTDNVTLDQGTFHAAGDKATGYTDPNDTSQWQRVVLTGTPARFRQTQDNGTLVHGQAQTLDYKVSENTVILTGNASVVQEGRGSFQGEKLTYNTDTGNIEGTAAAGGRVHITLQPRSKPASAASAAPASAPSSAGSTAPANAAPPASAASAPAPASSAAPASATSAAPAPAATTGTP